MKKKKKGNRKNFFTEASGSTAVLVGLTITVMLAGVGSAIDIGRAQLYKSRMAAALDAAGLAAAAVVSTADPTAEATKFFNVNFFGNNIDSNITLISLEATPNSDNTRLTLEAKVSMPTTIMGIFGHDKLVLSSSTEISRQLLGMELVLVLDTTGSMAGARMTALRDSAKALVNVLFGDRDTLDNFWVAAVPYVTTVNIGADKTGWLNVADVNSLYPANYPAGATKWKGCVEERTNTGGLDVNDTPPDPLNPATLFTPWFWPDSNQDNDWIANNGNITLNQNFGYEDANGKGPNIGCGQPVMPFTSSKATAISTIDALQYWRRGGTMSNVGTVWGWRMMSPQWRGMWGHELVNGEDILPLDYKTPLMKKVMVIMTDGENMFFDYGGTDPFYSDYTAYKRLDDMRPDINTLNQDTARLKINQKMADVCEAMKAPDKDIVIYTVTFQLSNGTAQNQARTLFRNCASKPEFYFDANSSVDLGTAFRAIGDSLANMRITK